MFVRKAIWPGFSGIRLESNDWFPFHLLFKQHDLVISMFSLSLSLCIFVFHFPFSPPFCSGGLRIVVTRNRAIREAASLCPRKTRSCCFIYLFLPFFFLFSLLRFLLARFVHVHISKYTNGICNKCRQKYLF